MAGASDAIEIRSEKVRDLVARAQKLSGAALQRVRDRVDDMMLHVQKRAVDRAPVGDTGHLRRSAQTSVRAETGKGLVAEISFGGMASAYAEVQHERDDYTHTRAEWAAKFGYARGMRTSLKTGKVSIRGHRGGALKVRGHKGGQAHFLYGDESSAWNAGEERMVTGQIEKALEAEADKL